MSTTLMAVLAHPDDESLGCRRNAGEVCGEGVEVHLVTATPGDAGRYRGIRPGAPGHPGAQALGELRAAELRRRGRPGRARGVAPRVCATAGLTPPIRGMRSRRCRRHLRRVRPDVVVTFGPDGAYGHPDHIAISQFTTAAVVAAADPAFTCDAADAARAPHAVSKLYYLAWPASTWAAYEAAIGAADRHRGRHHPSCDAVARLGHHNGHRHAGVLAVRFGCHLVSCIPGFRLHAADAGAARAPRGALGHAVVLPRVQCGERGPGTGDVPVRRHRRAAPIRRQSPTSTAHASRHLVEHTHMALLRDHPQQAGWSSAGPTPTHHRHPRPQQPERGLGDRFSESPAITCVGPFAGRGSLGTPRGYRTSGRRVVSGSR